jgi:hypothetical protein
LTDKVHRRLLRPAELRELLRPAPVQLGGLERRLARAASIADLRALQPILGNLVQERWAKAQPQNLAVRIVLPGAVHSRWNEIDVAMPLQAPHPFAATGAIRPDGRADVDPQTVQFTVPNA